MSAQPHPDEFLHFVQDPSGTSVPFGEKQARWLLERGFISGSPPLYSTLRSAEYLNERVLAEPSLHECDFCGADAPAWKVNTRAYDVQLGPTRGPIGGPQRPLFACDPCAGFVERNERRGLLEHAIEARLDRFAATGPQSIQAVLMSNPRHILRAAIEPALRELVYGVFANRRGRPERV